MDEIPATISREPTAGVEAEILNTSPTAAISREAIVEADIIVEDP